MKCDHKRMRYWAVPIVAAAMFAWAPPTQARDAKELMLKSVGTTENVSPVIAEAIRHAAMDSTPDQRKLAIQCWKNNVCETGHGNLTVAYADGFGENVWRQVTKMEFIAQALTYPSIKKIVYTSAGGDATKAISDMRAYIAQKVDVIVIFADAGPALLPTVKEADGGRYPRRPAQRDLCRWQGGQGFRHHHRRGFVCARHRFRQDGAGELQEGSDDDRRTRRYAGQRA